jgi:hypothetical protein
MAEQPQDIFLKMLAPLICTVLSDATLKLIITLPESSVVTAQCANEVADFLHDVGRC